MRLHQLHSHSADAAVVDGAEAAMTEIGYTGMETERQQVAHVVVAAQRPRHSQMGKSVAEVSPRFY
jgi:hypothetical protein